MFKTKMPAKNDTIEDVLKKRADALKDFDRAIVCLQRAQTTLAGAGFGKHAIYQMTQQMYLSGSQETDRRTLNEKMRRYVDKDLWNYLGKKLGLFGLMDVKTRKQWQQDIEKHAPECTTDALHDTFKVLNDKKGVIFMQGLVNAFASLSGHYKTNDPFKVGDRIIVKQCSRSNSYGRQRLVDVERALYILDGKQPPTRYDEGIEDAINKACGGAWEIDSVTEFKSDYFRGKVYKNGNAHVRFLNPTLRDRVNALIAKHYGDTIPDARGRC